MVLDVIGQPIDIGDMQVVAVQNKETTKLSFYKYVLHFTEWNWRFFAILFTWDNIWGEFFKVILIYSFLINSVC